MKDENHEKEQNDAIKTILKSLKSLKKTLRVFVQCLQFVAAMNPQSVFKQKMAELEEAYACHKCTCEYSTAINDIYSP